MGQRIDLTGKRFGRLVVLKTAPSFVNLGRTAAAWLCSCDCGAETVARAGNLLRGRSLSCGCRSRDVARQVNRKHGHSPWGGKPSPEYTAWAKMKQRCQNPNDPKFPDYGGRGIAVHSEWSDSFTSFFDSVGRRPSAAHSIDRINNDGNYEPGNVRWATREEQAGNTRRSRRAADSSAANPRKFRALG